MKKKLEKIQRNSFKNQNSEIRNKIICINSEEVEKVPIFEFINSQKKDKLKQKILRNQVIIVNQKKPQKSIDLKKRKKSKTKKTLSQNKANLIRKKKIQSVKEKQDKSIKKRSQKASLIRSTQKNSLKNLLSCYQQLKKNNNNNSIDKLQLKKMKQKVDEIQMMISLKMQNFKSKKRIAIEEVSRKKIEAAVKIQSIIRGYLVRKKFKNIFGIKPVQQRKFNSKKFIIQSNYGVFTFSKQNQDAIQSKNNNKIEQHLKFTLLNSVVLIEQQKDIIEVLKPQNNKIEELDDWQKQKMAIKKLELMMNSQNHGEKQIDELLKNMKEVVNKNLLKYQMQKKTKDEYNKDFSHKKKLKIELKKTYSKDEMDIWPNILKKFEPDFSNNSFINNNSEVSFFYTDKPQSKRKSTPLQKNKQISEDVITQKSLEEKDNTFLQTNIQNHEDTKEDFEFIEIPIQPFFQPDCQTKDQIVSDIEDMLLEDISKDSIWQAFLFFSQPQKEHIKQQTQMTNEQDEDDEETIYGIRTNINAVSEYSNLLIKYIEENHLEYFKDFISKSQNKKFFPKFNSNSKQEILLSILPNASYIQQNSNSIVKVSKKNDFFQVWKKQNTQNYVFTQQMYIELENQILDNYRDMNINEDLFIMQKIYHKCIFDAYNEILYDLITGNKKFELFLQEIRIQQKIDIDLQKVKFFLIKTKIILLESTMTLCGLIQDKEDSMLGNSLKKFDPESLLSLKKEKEQKLVISDFEQIIKSKNEQELEKHTLQKVKKDLVQFLEDILIQDLCIFISQKHFQLINNQKIHRNIKIICTFFLYIYQLKKTKISKLQWKKQSVQKRECRHLKNQILYFQLVKLVKCFEKVHIVQEFLLKQQLLYQQLQNIYVLKSQM